MAEKAATLADVCKYFRTPGDTLATIKNEVMQLSEKDLKDIKVSLSDGSLNY